MSLQRTKSVELGGSSFNRTVITESVQGWTREQVQATLRYSTLEIVQRQADIGNIASSITVDNSSYKQIVDAEKKIVVLFGTALADMVITAIQDAIIAAVEMSTDKHTGVLANLSNWEWIFVPGNGKGGARHVDPYSIGAMSIDDRLILRPARVIKSGKGGQQNYATAANQNVAGGRRGINFKTGKKASGKKMRANTGKGFFGAAAELIRRNSMINQSFSVYAGFTQRFAVPGETARAGKGGAIHTAQIVLRPKRRGRLK